MAELKELTIEKQFVPYDLALELKELGFDEPCNTCYDKLQMVSSYGKNVFDYKNYNTSGYVVSRPTLSQAFRFFRAKYNFVSEINVYSTSDGYSFSFKILCKKYTPYIEANNAWILYEDAEIECLKKLIEIAKEQNVK